jgi:hypothetical protein
MVTSFPANSPPRSRHCRRKRCCMCHELVQCRKRPSFRVCKGTTSYGRSFAVYMCVYAATVLMHACSTMASPVRESTDDMRRLKSEMRRRIDKAVKRYKLERGLVGWILHDAYQLIISTQKQGCSCRNCHMQKDATRTCSGVRPHNP